MSDRARPRLFSFARETELANLDAWVQDEAQRALLVELVDAFLEISRTRKIREETLAPIYAAASHPSPRVRSMGISRIAVLTHYFEEARDAFAKLLTHEDPSVRQFACHALAAVHDLAFTDLLPIALADPSWEVRKAAAQVCSTLRRSDVMGWVQQRLSVETDPRVQGVLVAAVQFQSRS